MSIIVAGKKLFEGVRHTQDDLKYIAKGYKRLGLLEDLIEANGWNEQEAEYLRNL